MPEPTKSQRTTAAVNTRAVARDMGFLPELVAELERCGDVRVQTPVGDPILLQEVADELDSILGEVGCGQIPVPEIDTGYLAEQAGEAAGEAMADVDLDPVLDTVRDALYDAMRDTSSNVASQVEDSLRYGGDFELDTSEIEEAQETLRNALQRAEALQAKIEKALQ